MNLFEFPGLGCYKLKVVVRHPPRTPQILHVIYGYYYEVVQGQTLNKPWLKYYKQYINNIFCIIKASSEHEALLLAKQNFLFASCEITWDVSLMVCLFLDMWVFKDPRDPAKIHFKPYWKARNHRERFSWISYHPIDVKQGTFLGEMSRLASLCSSRKLYSNAIYDLQQLYKVRGYPPRSLSEWTRNNLSTKWEDRKSVV